MSLGPSVRKKPNTRPRKERHSVEATTGQDEDKEDIDGEDDDNQEIKMEDNDDISDDKEQNEEDKEEGKEYDANSYSSSVRYCEGLEKGSEDENYKERRKKKRKEMQ